MTGILKVDQWKDSGDNALMTSDGAGNLSVDVNLGIKNSSPSHTLDISDTTTTAKTLRVGQSGGTGTADATMIISNGGSGNAMLRFDYEGQYTDRARIGVTSSGQTLRFYTAGANERMAIDNNGQVSKPAQSSFRAGRNSNYTPGAGADIIFNTVSGGDHYNIGNDYNTSNGRFTAPVAGRYLFITQILYQGVTDGTNMVDSIRFTTNGVERTYGSRRAYYRNTYTGDGGYFADFTTDIFNLNANDYVTVRAKKGNQVHGNDQYTIFTGYFLG